MANRRMQIGSYVLDALYRRGVRHIFGIPGDFALNFFRAIEQFKKLKLITFSHEPGLGFAADGLSRITRRLAAVAVTYGAGGLNIINAVACAYAEKSPLVVISGAPGTNERGKRILFHHQTKTLHSQLNIFKEVTAYQTVLSDQETAAEEIEKALTIAEQLASPVYIEIPRDMVFQNCRFDSKTKGFSLEEDLEAGHEVALEVARRLRQAKRSVLMVGVEVQRFGLIKEVVTLAEKLHIPVVSSFMARGTYPIDHPLFAGTYLGPAGDMKVMRMVETSDCLILLGVLLADTNMALRLSSLNPNHLVHAISRRVTVGHHSYENVTLQTFIHNLMNKTRPLPHRAILKSSPFPALKPKKYFDDSRLTVESIIQAINHLFQKQGPLPVVADNGDCLFASLDIHTPILLASGYYATMGFAVPAGLGVQIGIGKRPLILVGDGAFQMTGMELSHAPRMGLNPIVIVFNNRRWEMLRAIQPQGKYFDLTNWDFAKLAEIWGGVGISVRTKREMFDAVFASYREKKFVMIDAILPLGETSKVLRNYLKRIRG
jgi:indolepyruvate decarboxylase